VNSLSISEYWFKFLFGPGTVAFVFAVLAAQAKGSRTTVSEVPGTAAALLIAALLVGRLRTGRGEGTVKWQSGPVITIILVIELLASLVFLYGALIDQFHWDRR
jgi:hypothetical protein